MSPSVILRSAIVSLANAIDSRRETRERVHRRRRQGVVLRQRTNAFNVPEREFVKNFRLTKALVRRLITDLTPLLKAPRRRDGLSIELKVLTALAFYATGSYQTSVGQSSLYNLSQPSVSRAVREVTEALNVVYHKYVLWPVDRQARNIIKAQFYDKFRFPGVLGVIGGTHVAFIAPRSNEKRFINRKGFHSLNVMIICDAHLNIMCVDASMPGCTHDSSVWQNHPLSEHLRELNSTVEEQCFLLGDNSYPLRLSMITPILNTTEGTPENLFYRRHVTTRNTVERCIGVLKARFRCLLAARELHYDPVTAGKIVNACCVLHNIANAHGVPVEPLSPEEAAAEAEYSRRAQEEHELGTAAASALDTHNPRNRPVNVELQRGQALQQALVDQLWRERV